MRTEEFLDGYDACRITLQKIIAENNELQRISELMELAQFPYYKKDGKDWHPDCNGCKFRQLSMDYNLYCIKNINFEELGEHCEAREEGKADE